MADKRKYEEQLQQQEAQLQQQEAAKPASYESQWGAQIENALQQVLQRGDFSYDLNDDAFYQHYKKVYDQQGRQAMRDAYGQAAALTGGYGNSYAQTAAQQAWSGSQQQLQELIPELYALAMERYRMEGDSLQSKLTALQQQENADYSRYAEEFARWQSAYDQSYDRYADSRDYAYRQERDKTADAQWLKEFNEAVRQFNEKLWRM